jgi:hypothetical protein
MILPNYSTKYNQYSLLCTVTIYYLVAKCYFKQMTSGHMTCVFVYIYIVYIYIHIYIYIYMVYFCNDSYSDASSDNRLYSAVGCCHVVVQSLSK